MLILTHFDRFSMGFEIFPDRGGMTLKMGFFSFLILTEKEVDVLIKVIRIIGYNNKKVLSFINFNKNDRRLNERLSLIKNLKIRMKESEERLVSKIKILNQENNKLKADLDKLNRLYKDDDLENKIIQIIKIASENSNGEEGRND